MIEKKRVDWWLLTSGQYYYWQTTVSFLFLFMEAIITSHLSTDRCMCWEELYPAAIFNWMIVGVWKISACTKWLSMTMPIDWSFEMHVLICVYLSFCHHRWWCIRQTWKIKAETMNINAQAWEKRTNRCSCSFTFMRCSLVRMHVLRNHIITSSTVNILDSASKCIGFVKRSYKGGRMCTLCRIIKWCSLVITIY